jgi:hypothetical protein
MPIALSKLYEWQDPSELGRLVQEHKRTVGDDFLARPRNNKRFQEAWVLAEFARGLQLPRCRILEKDPPDAEVEGVEGRRLVEITALHTPERKIGAEYEKLKARPAEWRHISQREMAEADAHWRAWMLRRLAAKLSSTPRFDDLVVYNNISNLFGAKGWEELPSLIAPVVPPGWTGRVWQVKSGVLYLLWPSARAWDIPALEVA